MRTITYLNTSKFVMAFGAIALIFLALLYSTIIPLWLTASTFGPILVWYVYIILSIAQQKGYWLGISSMHKYRKYVSQYTTELPCCQLISVFNVLAFWGRQDEIPDLNSKEFHSLVDRVDCRKKGASMIEHAWKKYGMWGYKMNPTLENIQWSLNNGWPVGVTVESRDPNKKEDIYHIATVVGYSGNILHITNLYYPTPDALITYIPYHSLVLDFPPVESNIRYALSYRKDKDNGAENETISN